MSFTCHKSFSAELLNKYDGFILDQFGVMHNGKTGLEGAAELVLEMHALGKKLIILSNTSSTSDAALRKLPTLGFDPAHFLGAVTSGEEASRYVRETTTYGGKTTTTKALWITWPDTHTPSPDEFLRKCGDNLELLDPRDESSVDRADLILGHGCGVLRGGGASVVPLGDFFTTGNTDDAVLRPFLERCRANDVPLVCANPDFVTVAAPDDDDGTSSPRRRHMPGAYARLYEEVLGGRVKSFGKPHVPHFRACLRDLGLSADRVAHVGDSLHHDVQGANKAGIDSVFVVGGVHQATLGTPGGELPSEDRLRDLFATEGGHVPTHVVPLFRS